LRFLQILVILLSFDESRAANQLRGSELHRQATKNGLTVTRHREMLDGTEGLEAMTHSEISWYGTDTESSSSSSSLVDRPVYFFQQMDDPNDTFFSPRIVGGSDSVEQRNFCMHLRWDDLQQQYVNAGCGGVLISNCHILTAAHCSSDERLGLPDGVYCNAYNPFQGNYGKEFHFSTLRDRILHPDFDDYTNQHDVSVLELETCIDDMSDFPPMKVADPTFMSQLKAGEKLFISGFGRLQEEYTGVQVEHLQSAQVPYINQSACNEYYPSRVSDDMVCAGFVTTGGVDACQGDSGGPLFFQGITGDDTNQTLVGAVSWGSGCAEANQPGVYASVAYHYDWIKGIVCNDTRMNTSALELCTVEEEDEVTSLFETTRTVENVTTTTTAACAARYESCEDVSCCGNYTCSSLWWGITPTCRMPVSDERGESHHKEQSGLVLPFSEP